METVAPLCCLASRTVSYTGTPSSVWPPLPGVTPATSLVPYASEFLLWNMPASPVKPWQRILVLPSTRTVIGVLLCVPWRRRIRP
jgi:hypothetical protein